MLLNQDTGLERSTTSSGAGAYAFYDLAIDTYTLKFSADGFSEAKFPGLNVQAERTITLNAKLAVGAVTSTVTVDASPLPSRWVRFVGL